jgi:hypothetical protein
MPRPFCKIDKCFCAFVLFSSWVFFAGGLSICSGFELEPLRVRPDLEWDIPSYKLESQSPVEFRQAYIDRQDNYYLPMSHLPENEGKAEWNTLKGTSTFHFKSFSLSVSHYRERSLIRDSIHQKSDDQNKKWHMIKALPSAWGTASYQEKLESVGKIFEPQVNMDIHF